jgi:hypothetical protein
MGVFLLVMHMGHPRLLQSSAASKITNMAVKLIGSHEHMNRPSACFEVRSWIENIATQCAGMIAAMAVVVKNNSVIQV